MKATITTFKLNRANKMYRHDLFYLQQEWEAWLAPVYKQIQTTKSQLTQCTMILMLLKLTSE